ncbi:MAG: DUF1697 domain-containing protein [Polyangiaceae bacterium]|nr:DUF1697 domain-containing protein [Myxococcales bacterium]MCB9588018.1 DUF1697 domain-containing protein [Polyangiaceae bacterium]
MPGKSLTTYIALFRGINVGGNKKLPMAELRALCEELGLGSVRTYIQSGNLAFRSGLDQSALEQTIEKAVKGEFGFHADVIARTAKQWKSYAKASAFPDAEEARPKFLHLGLSKQKPAKGCISKLEEYAKLDERLALKGDALWVDFVGGAGRSKLTPAVFDRAVGSTVTLRNWRSVQAISALLEEVESD